MIDRFDGSVPDVFNTEPNYPACFGSTRGHGLWFDCQGSDSNFLYCVLANDDVCTGPGGAGYSD